MSTLGQTAIVIIGLVANIVTVAVFAGALWLWSGAGNPLVKRALLVDRRRTIGRVLQQQGVARAVRRDAVASIVGRQLVGGRTALTVAAEISWLQGIRTLTSDGRPVEVHGISSQDPAESLRELADAYDAFALRLQGRGLLGGHTSGLIEALSEVATAVSLRLGNSAAFALQSAEPLSLPALRMVSGDVVTFGPVAFGTGRFSTIDSIAVTHVPHRRIVPGTDSERLAAIDGVAAMSVGLSQTEAALLAFKFDNADRKTFDSVMPALSTLAPPLIQRDPASGHTRLHLVLEETSFSAVVVCNYVGEHGVGRSREQLNGESNLLTLSLLPVTADGYCVLTRRTGRVGIAGGKLSVAVTGNLEMRPRLGIPLDRDADGLPDPMLAIAREASEELNLEVDPRAIEVLGLATIDTAQEVGTTVLLTKIRLAATFEEVVARAAFADRVEGAWEIEDEILGVPEPRDVEGWAEFASWVSTDAACVAHLSSTVVAMSAAAQSEEFGAEAAVEYLRRFAKSASGGGPPRDAVTGKRGETR